LFCFAIQPKTLDFLAHPLGINVAKNFCTYASERLPDICSPGREFNRVLNTGRYN
jgi:hypothetical protein